MSLLHIGDAEEHYNVAGTRVLKYTQEMSHKGLNEHKLISAPELTMLRNKVKIQADKWAEKWDTTESKRKQIAQKQANAEEALNQTQAAEEAVEQIENLLFHTLSIDDTIDWESLKWKEPFPDKKPPKPAKQNYETIPRKPEKTDEIFLTKFTFFEKIFKGLKNKKIAEYDKMYTDTITAWENQRVEIENANKVIDENYNKAISSWQRKVSEWENKKNAFLQEQANYNANIDAMKEAYIEKNPTAIIEYCEMVLNNSQYPESFSKDFEIEYNPENAILIVEYQLPNMEMMPKVKEVKYLASKNELKEAYFTEAQISKMFDEAMYKIALRTIHELFEADVANALECISFNGWVRAINKGTGKEENNCIISLQVKKAEFLEIDLRNVEPKICFRNLKGVSGSKLSSLTPIKPILQIDKTDNRFVDSYGVADSLDNSTNLAAMD